MKKVFTYNLWLEENLGKNSSKNNIKQSEQKLFKKYEKVSKNYLLKIYFKILVLLNQKSANIWKQKIW